MSPRRSRQAAGEAGYTLTEMLVVIAIIALIAAVLTPGLINQLGRARAKAAQLQLESVAASVESYRSDVGHYPTEQEGKEAILKQTPCVEGWSGPYLKDAKGVNDPWGHPVLYVLTDEGNHFYVQSLGSDGKPGGSGTARDIKAPVSP